MAVKVLKERPKWLEKIAKDHFKIQNRLFEARMRFVAARIQIEETIETINTKFDTEFTFDDLCKISNEEVEQAIDMLDLDDDDGDDD